MNIGIIPARLDSKRFPKKILKPLNGKPMIANTVERSLMAKRLDKVILAIDSEETKKALKGFDFEIKMTSKDHNSGTDRVAEVVESIKEELKRHKLESSLDQLLIPTHQVTEVKKGKRTKKEKKYFPGYVLIKIELTKQIYHLIKNLQKVSGFLGSSDKPTPISDNEIKRILGQVSESAINQKTGISFEIGEKVKVCDGPFASFTGLIEQIDEEKSRLKVSVSIFGRATPVDLEFNQVEKN